MGRRVTHGGAREGAGRPEAPPGTKMVLRCLSLRRDQVKALKTKSALRERSVAELVREAIDQWLDPRRV